jgi:hypothetical protein
MTEVTEILPGSNGNMLGIRLTGTVNEYAYEIVFNPLEE